MRTVLRCSLLAAVYSNSRHADTQTRRCTETQAHTHTDALAQTHRHTDTRTHTNEHTHTHTPAPTHRETETETETGTETHARTNSLESRQVPEPRLPAIETVLLYQQFRCFSTPLPGQLHLKSCEQALWKEFAMTTHSFGKQATGC